VSSKQSVNWETSLSHNSRSPRRRLGRMSWSNSGVNYGARASMLFLFVARANREIIIFAPTRDRFVGPNLIISAHRHLIVMSDSMVQNLPVTIAVATYWKPSFDWWTVTITCTHVLDSVQQGTFIAAPVYFSASIISLSMLTTKLVQDNKVLLNDKRHLYASHGCRCQQLNGAPCEIPCWDTMSINTIPASLSRQFFCYGILPRSPQMLSHTRVWNLAPHYYRPSASLLS
jgi:hypothetical protein